MIPYGEIDPITKKPIVNCPSYVQCPICYKCDNTGVLVKCNRCVAAAPRIHRCKRQETREFAIRRENFSVRVRG